MWSLDNQTPFAAERAWVRDKNGAEVWVVAIKGTFEFTVTGQMALAEAQIPVKVAPEYTGENNEELLCDTDVHEYKLATDVILNGTAYAPGNEPSKQWDVNLRVGSVNKTLRVRGDRFWQRGFLGFSLTEAQPVVSQPLGYRYAYGGQTTSEDGAVTAFCAANPIGRGYAEDKMLLVDQPGPNIEYPDCEVIGWNDRPAPAGFAAIPGHWTGRSQFAGIYDQAWQAHRQPLLPEDFNPRFFQCSPEDQQVPGFLKGGETVELTHLMPTARVSFRLPKPAFYLRTTFTDGHKITHRTSLHTVIIEPDKHRLMLVWHSHLPCHHRVNLLEKTQIRLKRRILRPEHETGLPLWTDGKEAQS